MIAQGDLMDIRRGPIDGVECAGLLAKQGDRFKGYDLDLRSNAFCEDRIEADIRTDIDKCI